MSATPRRKKTIGASKVIAWLLLALSCASCKVYDPELVAQACQLKSIPSRPAPTGGDSKSDLVFVLANLEWLNQDGAATTRSYDLDGSCTRAPNFDNACVTQDNLPIEDGEQGQDNVFAKRVTPFIFSVFPEAATNFQVALEQGVGAVWAKVHNWNGEVNDSEVQVDIAQTVFGVPGDLSSEVDPGQLGTPLDADWPYAPPIWNGDDHFWLRASDFFSGGLAKPRFVDDDAYISEGTLVARIPDQFVLSFYDSERKLSVILVNAYLIAEISIPEQSILEASIVGSWRRSDALTALPDFGLCPDSVQVDFSALQRFIDSNLDLYTTGGVGSSVPSCDALSIGLHFSAYRANTGGLHIAPDINACVGQGT
ncbi:MAG: hypothetical protein IPJ88_04590 [Myxococcales bacterium]|nr:MAG: hypothetical protein IPJ88_04590 [Myxococcales bacterium]